VIKTAVIGASGYVGRHLLRAYRLRFPDCVGTTYSAETPGLKRFDIREPNLTMLRLEDAGHQAVLIASAKPNIAYCEQNKEAAYAVNVKGTLELIRQIGRTRMQAIFLSSDYVFAGRAGPHDDDHPTRPATEYGRHKAEVEREMPSLAANYLVLRLSKIYGMQKGDKTLLDEMAGLLAAGNEIRAARDQFFCPTNVGDLVRVVQQIQDCGMQGIVNACSPERWSRSDIALALADALRVDRSLVKPISLYDIPAMAGRPLDTSMKSSRLADMLRPTFVALGDDIGRVAALWGSSD
jgi:dTDP-4-dehydrorhamnose reductase